ncbi:hypothetical protein LIER_15152 [Lithospermum erythrorhizon]|uniref:Transposase MuDR plant domain-containing protein n=1 Tax=Lithospermum erythrorhizon TaxID=34254 RepID=A0AAV3Q1V7_LITER
MESMLKEKKDFFLLEWYPTSGEEENLGQNKEVGDEYLGPDVFVIREDEEEIGRENDNIIGEAVAMMMMLVKGMVVKDNLDDDVESNGDDGDRGNDDIGPLLEAEYEDSDQLKELSEEEEEEGECSSTRKRKRTTTVEGVLYNKEVHLRNPVLVPCMVFANVGEFRDLIRAYAVHTNKPLKFIKNDKLRLCVHCEIEDCNFSIFCSRIGKTSNLSIKTMIGESIRNRSVTINFLVRKYINRIRRTAKISL